MNERSRRSEQRGFRAQGTRFYVWEEDLADLEVWAAELEAAERAKRHGRPARLREARAIRRLSDVLERMERA